MLSLLTARINVPTYFGVYVKFCYCIKGPAPRGTYICTDFMFVFKPFVELPFVRFVKKVDLDFHISVKRVIQTL